MCGIAGVYSTSGERIPNLDRQLKTMAKLQIHRGPDGQHEWSSKDEKIGFAHQRLSIIDLESGDQPMRDDYGNVICFNGEIYNYLELREELKGETFRTTSDTEVALAAYRVWGEDFVNKLRGMFAIAIWDEKKKKLFCARDQFGIKPFYYTQNNGCFYFASEAKALLPFVKEVEVNKEALKDYLVFQLYLEEKTLFKDIHQLTPGHILTMQGGNMNVRRYWEVFYNIDFHHTRRYFEEELKYALEESVNIHLRSDVPVGAYISGGVDSSIVAGLAKQTADKNFVGFVGKFSASGENFDESQYAAAQARMHDIPLYQRDITHDDFTDNIAKVIYHLDMPVAGPGSFAQFCISELASKHRKVVLGGQGGDEIFGGYVRYLIAYFEQCIKGAIDGSLANGNFVVTYESIIKNLRVLGPYKPMLKEFFSAGLFEPIDQRYFKLINRAPGLSSAVNWQELPESYNPFTTFQRVFNAGNVGKESYFDKMTHFDFKTLLPGLLHVEDRMSMAFGLESRVPLLDVPVVELAARMPADVKFKDGNLKMVLQDTMRHLLCPEILNRKSKMGFPVPISQWMKGPIKGYMHDILGSRAARSRGFLNSEVVVGSIGGEGEFSRNLWGVLSLELWHQQFCDRASEFKKMAPMMTAESRIEI